MVVSHPRRHATPPDILVIVIDSLRADHLGSYGYSRATTPFLDGWAAQAALFSEAYTHGTQTRIAMSSLFTGTLPTLQPRPQRQGGARQRTLGRGRAPAGHLGGVPP
jgi:glucan phosphoethanolaminetransferase (alkaline phosphatase superfamily)